MVQSEDEVSRSYFSHKPCKGINVKGVDSLLRGETCTQGGQLRAVGSDRWRGNSKEFLN
jgi:hypothetical protein